MRRTLPFPGFSRGIPIVGQNEEPEHPKGGYFYQIPVLIQRPGLPLEADTFEVQLVRPMLGVAFFARVKEIAEVVRERNPELPAPKIIALSTIFLGFVPQSELDLYAAQKAEEKQEIQPC